MSEHARTHRDTLAFVLTILGASLWSMIPTAALLRQEGLGPEIGLPLTFAAGALLGAWSATTLWRHVAWPMPALAAGLIAIVVVGIQRKAACGSFDFRVLDVVAAASAAAGGAAGSVIGARARLPRRALVAAWITISGPAILMLAIGIVAALGYESDGGGIAWLVMLSAVPASMIAARLCGGVRARPFAAWMFALSASAFLVGLWAANPHDVVERSVGSLFFAGFLTWLTSIPVRRYQLRHPPREDLPSAQVVDR